MAATLLGAAGAAGEAMLVVITQHPVGPTVGG